MYLDVPPGLYLAEVLDQRGMTQTEFARRCDLSAKHVNQIIRGRAGYSADLAIRFDRVLGIDAAFWLKLQMNYRTERARERFEKAATAT